jgi:hypothetical protein
LQLQVLFPEFGIVMGMPIPAGNALGLLTENSFACGVLEQGCLEAE